MIAFICEYWVILVICVAVGAAIGAGALHFIRLPNTEQVKSIKEWLLYAVSQAEKELGGGTGQLKLRQVYDMFLIKFANLAPYIPFDLFSSWVDEALEIFKRMLESNKNVVEYVNK